MTRTPCSMPIEIGERLAIGVVEVHTRLATGSRADRAQHRLGLSGVPTPMVSPSEIS